MLQHLKILWQGHQLQMYWDMPGKPLKVPNFSKNLTSVYEISVCEKWSSHCTELKNEVQSVKCQILVIFWYTSSQYSAYWSKKWTKMCSVWNFWAILWYTLRKNNWWQLLLAGHMFIKFYNIRHLADIMTYPQHIYYISNYATSKVCFVHQKYSKDSKNLMWLKCKSIDRLTDYTDWHIRLCKWPHPLVETPPRRVWPWVCIKGLKICSYFNKDDITYTNLWTLQKSYLVLNLPWSSTVMIFSNHLPICCHREWNCTTNNCSGW